MSRIAILGVTGRAGSRIANELLQRGHTVTGIARNIRDVAARDSLTLQAADATNGEELVPLLRGHDAVVSAMPFVGGGDAATVIAATRQAGVPRLLVVGGAGSLEVAPGVALVDTPDFPAAYKVESLKGRAFLATLQGEKELDWTFLSPSALFEPGERTGKFRLGKDELLTAENGESSISYEDFAIALVDEIETPANHRERFTVGY